MPDKTPLPTLEAFPHRTADTIRYGDLDAQGHVNNAVFSTFFETGRVAMFRRPGLGIAVEGATYVLARMEIDYRRELHWPGTVDIGSSIERFGRTSFTMLQGVFNNGACAATGRATLVMLDITSRKPTPLPEDEIARLSAWMHRGE